MTIYRERSDATLINALANLPQNARGLARYQTEGQPFDFDAILPLICMLTNGEDACMLLEEKEPRLWECCTIYGPTCRGGEAVRVGLEMKEYMRPWADTVFGSVPDALPEAKWFYRKMGGVAVDLVETDNFVYEANDGETLYRMDM